MDAKYPFRTTDKKLAYALALAGCEFAPLAMDGPATNTYSLGFMKQLTPRGARRFPQLEGMSADAAAIELHDAKIPGTVEYCFVRNATLAEAIAAYDEMVDLHALAKAEGRPMVPPAISARVVMQVMFLDAHSQEEFKKVPFVNRMRQLASTLTSTAQKCDEPGVEAGAGSGKVWSIFGSAELKKYLKV